MGHIHTLRMLAVFMFVSFPVLADDDEGFEDVPAKSAQSKGGRPQQETVSVPLPGHDIKIVATMDKPKGQGPWPYVIVNHGVPGPAYGKTANISNARSYFLAKGYIVVNPSRRGWGLTGGREPHPKPGCNLYEAASEEVKDIEAVLAYMQEQPFTKKQGNIVVGQSVGGYLTIVLSSKNPEGVVAMINFAGGRGEIGAREQTGCRRDSLNRGAKFYGSLSKVPMLWIYTENDSFFGPRTSKGMHDNYVEGGGNAKYILLPPFGDDGHEFFRKSKGWYPLVDEFLKEAVRVSDVAQNDTGGTGDAIERQPKGTKAKKGKAATPVAD